MKWVEVSVKTASAGVDAVANVLYDAGVHGVVIEDASILELPDLGDDSWELVDESFLEQFDEWAVVKGYLPDTSDVAEQVSMIRKAVHLLPEYGLDIGPGRVTFQSIDEEDWSESWKKHFKPVKPGSVLVIKPIWETYEKMSGEVVLELDPGMAFGTGTHETTVLCLQELEQRIQNHSVVLDIGCGSGILSIASALLGSKKVVGIDLDPVAVQAAQQNVFHNQVEDRVQIRQGDLLQQVEEKADLLVSNIIAEIIIHLSPQVRQCLVPGGLWIASGIIWDKLPLVERAMKEAGLDILQTRSLGEWVVVVAKAR